MRLLLLIAFLSGLAGNVLAAAQDYAKYFEVDLEEKFPSYEALSKKYLEGRKIVDRGYDYHWKMEDAFNRVFRLTISSYGGTDKRLKAENEEELLQMLRLMPPETYQYIGPYLHTVPNISEKVLNMPGIRETKNKFPSRIAPELADVEDLEFLSPYLYYVLMPEAWPSYRQRQEKPRKRPAASVKVVHDPAFFAKLKKIVPEEDFYPDAPKETKLGMSDLRTVEPDKNSLLTSADVKAFINTLDGVEAFGKEHLYQIYNASFILDEWEKERGEALPVNALKDSVNPCQRLVQKIRVAGLEREFTKTVVGEGFDAKGWAYTCDKTIKAYRMSMLTRSAMVSIMLYKKGIYDSYTDSLGPKTAEMQYSAMQSVIEMYKAPRRDVEEVRKNRTALRNKLNSINNYLVGSPIVILK